MTREIIELSVLTSLEDRARVFERMVAEGRAGIVQYSLPRPSLAAWMEGTAPDRAWLCALSVAAGRDRQPHRTCGGPAGEQAGLHARRSDSECRAGRAAERDHQESAIVWITDFMGKSALYNFAVFRGYGHLYREFCRVSCAWAFSGGLDCLMGVTPSVNRAALAAMRGSGWREVFRIPRACYMARLGRHVDGILSHCTPELLQTHEVSS